MWRTNAYWFDVAVATTGLMLGHLFFGRFEEHKPRWRRLLKSLLGIALVVGTSAGVSGVTCVASCGRAGCWRPKAAAGPPGVFVCANCGPAASGCSSYAGR